MDIQPLLTLQEIDGRLRDLEKEIKDMPKRRIQAQKRLEVAARAIDQAKNALDVLSRSANAYGEEARKQRERADKMAKNQIALRSMKAFKASALEIDNAEAAASEAASKLDAISEILTPEELHLKEATLSYQQEDQIVQEMLDGVAERKAAIEAEFIKVKAEREIAIANVADQERRYYDRLCCTRWPAVTEINRINGVCLGCNLIQPPSVSQMVLRNEKMVVCQSCGRILY